MTKEQIFLLKWLSKEDSSSMGECEGKDLSYLVGCGFAKIFWDKRGIKYITYSRVSLTEKGRKKVKEYENQI
jgi:hypothetical protein